MKIGIIGDIHLNRTDPLGIITPTGLNSRLLDKIEALKFCLDKAKDCGMLVLLGDIFEVVNPSKNIEKIFWKTLAPYIKSNKDRQVIIIRGNHDTTGQVTNIAAEMHIAPDNLIFVDEEPYHTKVSAQKGMSFIPYLENVEILNGWLKEYSTDILFGHLEINGCLLGPTNHKVRFPLNKEAFATYKRVILGHIHKFQDISDTITYLGDIVYNDFGERNDRKVMGILDTPTLQTEYIDIPQRPMIQTEVLEEDVNSLLNKNEIPPEIDIKGALVKIVLIGSAAWLKTWNKKKIERRFKNALKVFIEEKRTDKIQETLISPTNNIIDKTVAYGKLKKADEALIKVGVELAKLSQQED
jgi:DNA repair exonuclease SbcCD nuclease subunit